MDINPGDGGPERLIVLKWLEGEWPYSDKKWSPALREEADEDLSGNPGFVDGRWPFFIGQYLHRVGMLGGMSTPRGRQALMKTLNTVLPACESMVRVFGSPPAPGINSGEIREWTI